MTRIAIVTHRLKPDIRVISPDVSGLHPVITILAIGDRVPVLVQMVRIDRHGLPHAAAGILDEPDEILIVQLKLTDKIDGMLKQTIR